MDTDWQKNIKELLTSDIDSSQKVRELYKIWNQLHKTIFSYEDGELDSKTYTDKDESLSWYLAVKLTWYEMKIPLAEWKDEVELLLSLIERFIDSKKEQIQSIPGVEEVEEAFNQKGSALASNPKYSHLFDEPLGR